MAQKCNAQEEADPEIPSMFLCTQRFGANRKRNIEQELHEIG
jgi:hypothetical protein